MPSHRPLPRVYKSRLMLDVEAMFFGEDIRLVLISHYNQLGSIKAVARRLGLSPQTIQAWFRTLDIVIQQRSVALLRSGGTDDPPM